MARNFATDRRVQIPDFLPNDAAEASSRCLLSPEMAWSQAFFLDGKVQQRPLTELRALPAEQQMALVRQVHALAAEGIGFWYGRHAPGEHSPAAVQRLVTWLNSPAVLDVIGRISGCAGLKSASAQATRFAPEDFLTRHRDEHEARRRKLAFVLNPAPRWHPDWDGLLQFYTDDGTPRDAWTPRFNSLSLFEVDHVHAVTTVAPFAAVPRVAVSGWFRLN